MNRFEGEVIDEAMSEVVPLSVAQDAHLSRVVNQHVSLTRHKYVEGQKAHGGQCWEKPGMLAHALDEAADLPVYLWTLAEQMRKLADRLREGFITKEEAATEIERWLLK